MERGNIKGKKDYFIKNLSPPTVFKQSSSNFHSLVFDKFQKDWLENEFAGFLFILRNVSIDGKKWVTVFF